MKAKLPRIMLWKDKTSMEEFLHEPINERLYDFYLELKNTRWHFGPDNNALLLFNEIYYQLTKVEYENNLDFNFDDYTQEIEANTGKEHSIVFVYEMFFAFLLLRENNSIVARHFQKMVYLKYKSTWNKSANCAMGAIIKEDKKYIVDLKPHPCPVTSLESGILHWDEITNNFNQSYIKQVLDLWSSKEEKITALHLIEEAYKRISRGPVKAEKVMSFIRVADFFPKMYSELGGKNGAGMEENIQMRILPAHGDKGLNSVEETNREDELPSVEDMVAACEITEKEGLWWANTAWSVSYRIYCILGYKGSKESFITEVARWPFKKPFKYICNRDSLGRPLRCGKISGPLEKWSASGASIRQVNLGESLMKIIKTHRKCSVK